MLHQQIETQIDLLSSLPRLSDSDGLWQTQPRVDSEYSSDETKDTPEGSVARLIWISCWWNKTPTAVDVPTGCQRLATNRPAIITALQEPIGTGVNPRFLTRDFVFP